MAELHTVPTPHDRLARRVLARPAAAAIILRRVLPANVIAGLALDRIRVVSTAFVGPRLGAGHSDLVYAIGVRGSPRDAVVFAILEHQSSSLRLLPLRMFWYAGWLWERDLADRGPRSCEIPLILPIVMVQCPSTWNVPNRLSELIDIPKELRGVLRSPIELELIIDDMSESVLNDPVADPEVLALVELTRALLSAYHDQASITDARIQQLAPLFDRVLHTSPEDAEALWTYVISVFGEDSPFRTLLLDAVNKENQRMYATMKDLWLAEGLAKGLGKALLAVLEHRNLAVTADVQQRVVDTLDEPTLQRWLQRALAADSIDRVFEPMAEA